MQTLKQKKQQQQKKTNFLNHQQQMHLLLQQLAWPFPKLKIQQNGYRENPYERKYACITYDYTDKILKIYYRVF